MSDITKIMEAYLGMVSDRNAELEEGCGKKMYKEGQEECPKCEGKGCDHCDDKGYHEVSEKKLDPVDDKANDKKFKDRKDKDIDNDGDVDSSDEYLHKRRAATDDAIDAKDDEENPVKKNPKTADKKSEISKIKIESLDLRSDFEKMWSAIEEALDPKKGALTPEKYDDHSSDHDKKVIAQHKKSDKKVEDSVEDAIKKTFAAGGKSQKKAKEPDK
jgi:hypothetical protein